MFNQCGRCSGTFKTMVRVKKEEVSYKLQNPTLLPLNSRLVNVHMYETAGYSGHVRSEVKHTEASELVQ